MKKQYARTLYKFDPNKLGLRPVMHRVSDSVSGFAYCSPHTVVLDMETVTDQAPPKELYCKNCIRSEFNSGQQPENFNLK